MLTNKENCALKLVDEIILDDSVLKKVYEWTARSTRSKGIPKHRWGDDVKSEVANMRIINWKDCMRNRPKCNEFAEKGKTSLKL